MKVQSSSRQLDSLLRRTFSCPSCSTLRLSESSRPLKRQRIERHASTVSTTAINGKKPIPQRNRPLHEALTEVRSKASAHVNLSRFQLALQGLESENPVTRIAILGLDVQDTARRIARLLLADALENAQPWEEQILVHEGRNGIVIRHGQPQNTNIPQRSPLPVLLVPAPALERLNVELLVAPINAEHTDGISIPTEAFLAPAVGVPTAFDGRQVTVNQPVHKTLLVASGFEELVEAIGLVAGTNFRTEEDRNSIAIVANLPESNPPAQGRVVISDVTKAEQGLMAIRQSTSNATTYEHKWLGSGMPQLSEWVRTTAATASSDNVLPQVVKSLVSSLLTSAARSIDDTAVATAQNIPTTILDAHTRIRIEDAVEDFSRAAHSELQSGLASAWSSRNWRKLSWYKLFWRVDDTGLIVSDLVTNSWLPKTERATYELSGRLTQLGINPIMADAEVPELEHITAFETETAQATILDPATPVVLAATTAPANEIIIQEPTRPVVETIPGTDKPVITMKAPFLPMPITAAISSARAGYMRQQIAELTNTAQQLVLRTFTISGFSAGLSALTYVSQIAPTLYEAGSIFAVGTIFALYRMQSSWQQATKGLEHGLFEEGRDVIRRVVQRMRELVQSKAAEVHVGDPVERQMLEDARSAVQKAQAALEDLESDATGHATAETSTVR